MISTNYDRVEAISSNNVLMLIRGRGRLCRPRTVPDRLGAAKGPLLVGDGFPRGPQHPINIMKR